MSDTIQTGMTWLAGMLAAHAAVACILTPDKPRLPIPVRASMGQARVEAPDAGGAVVIVDTRHYSGV